MRKYILQGLLLFVIFFTTFLAYAADKYADKKYSSAGTDWETYDSEEVGDDNLIADSSGFHAGPLGNEIAPDAPESEDDDKTDGKKA